MPTTLTIRPPEGDSFDMAFEDGVLVDPHGADGPDLDTADLWALPGLADAHAHLTMTSPRDIFGITEETMRANMPVTAWAQVDRGVLLILDKGGCSDTSLISLDYDPTRRPFVEVAGAMIHPAGGYVDGFGEEVEPEDLIDHVRDVAAKRGGWVKLVGDWPRKGLGPVNNYSLERLTEAVDVIHAAGARVAIHTMAYAASDAVAAGVDSIEHGPFLTEQDLGMLAARHGAWVPTVVNLLDVIDLLGAESSGGTMLQRGLDQMRDTLPLAEELGVTVLAGTDMAVPHGEVSAEALRLREYGLSDRAATIASSTAAYEYTGRPEPFAVGQPASVVFFRENPYDDVEALTRPALIVHHGRVVRDER